jgi:CubicO group peptidase (beta-lactamase class C family)
MDRITKKEAAKMIHKRLYFASLIIVLIGSGLASACSSLRQPAEREALWPTEEWQTSTPEEQGMDADKLNEMMEMIDGRGVAIDSVLVIRNGYIVFEQYRNGYEQMSSHHIQSVTKSFTSTLVGIAIKEGFLKDADQRVVDFFPERTIANLDSRKQNMTLEHLLTMSEGMDWHEVDLPYTHPDNSLGQMWKKDDVIQHVLDQAMVREPGEAWNYNSGTSILLGNIVEQASGQSVLSFARKYLFDPLGIGDLYWSKADGSHYHTDGGLYMMPRDMARLGYLMLNDGVWDGKQILPPDWVSTATTAHYQTHGTYRYGYQWWLLPQDGIYAATGHYGQAIYVIPEADLVVVFTANIADEAIHPEDGFLIRHILGACNDPPPELTQQTYANYGFTYDYGTEFSVRELPTSEMDEISQASGTVQFSYISYPIEILNVWWDEAVSGQDAEAILKQAFDSMSEDEQLAFLPGEAAKVWVDDKELQAQYFTLSTEGLSLSGMVGAWVCDQADRGYVLSYLTDAEFADSDLQDRFGQVFDSFTCQ